MRETQDALTKLMQPKIFQAFKKKGFMLRTESTKFIVGTLSDMHESEWGDCLKRIIDAIDKENLSSSVLELAVVEAAVGRCISEANDHETGTPANSIAVVDAFSVPRLVYDMDRKAFFPARTDATLFSEGEAKGRLFRERYMIVHQRLQRNSLFCPPPIMTDDAPAYHKIIPIDSLQGMGDVDDSLEDAQARNVTLLGMLSQIEEGKWFLEDISGSVPLNLGNITTTKGLFVETGLVLLQGYYHAGTFHALVMGLPPAESSKQTKEVFKNVNFFGGPAIDRDYVRLKTREEHEADAFIATLSDVWLDKPEVLARLRTLFRGFSESPPVAIILIGNFCSSPYGRQNYQAIKQGFDELGHMLSRYPRLVAETKFIFVPGPLDPGPANALPRPAIPAALTSGLREVVPEAVFTSNPCRIRYYTQEIVVMREDLISKMRRQCVVPPSTTDGYDVNHHMVATLLDQGHLCPLALQVRPIYWAYDHALRLYPLPDVEQYEIEYEGDVKCFNPGPLPSDFSFFCYWPAEKRVENSQIPDDNMADA